MKRHNKVLLGFAIVMLVISIYAGIIAFLSNKFGEWVILVGVLLVFFIFLPGAIIYALEYESTPSPRQLKKENEKLKAELEKQKYIEIYEEADLEKYHK